MRKLLVLGFVAFASTVLVLVVPLPAISAEQVAPSAEPTVLTAEQLQRDRDRVALAELIVDAYPNWNGFFSSLVANWSPDGKHIVFGSLRDGLPEIYAGEVAKSSARPRQITRGPDRAIWGRYSIDGKQILFLRDAKGDENHHIWIMNADGTSLRDLTPGETMHRDEPVLPRKRPSLMLYSASRTTNPSSMLFIQSLTDDASKLIYTNPNPGGLSDVSPDATRALFVEWHSPDDVVLLEVDVESGKARRVYPDAGKKVGIFSANYSADGRGIYVTTDEGIESSVLLALDRRTNREVARYVNDAPATAPMNAVVSPAGDRVAVRIDAGNHGQVRILNSKTLALERKVGVPLGDVGVGAFRDDGKTFSILISLPSHPADVYEVDARTGKLSRLREDRRPGLDSLPAIDATIETVTAFDG